MEEIRFHGRGGQGAVTAATILAKAAFYGGKYSQAFPAFGVERRGAPVLAFTRISEEPISIKCQIYEPDHAIVLDPTLMEFCRDPSNPHNPIRGLRKGGIILVNSMESSEKISEDFGLGEYRVFAVDATKIALDTLGRPIVNTAILGAFSAVSGLVDLDAIEKAVRAVFPEAIAEKNCEAVRRAYEEVSRGGGL